MAPNRHTNEERETKRYGEKRPHSGTAATIETESEYLRRRAREQREKRAERRRERKAVESSDFDAPGVRNPEGKDPLGSRSVEEWDGEHKVEKSAGEKNPLMSRDPSNW